MALRNPAPIEYETIKKAAHAARKLSTCPAPEILTPVVVEIMRFARW